MLDTDTDEASRVRRYHVLGLDLGQSTDPSALTVVQKTEKTGQRPTYALVWIERFQLGTPYTDVVRRVAAVKRAPETGQSPRVVMDATGIGAPVVDQFHDEGLFPTQILFTGGDKVVVDGSTYKVPKADLATTVQTLLQAGRLTIAERLKHAGELVTEMKRFRVKFTAAGHARFEHATESDSDDVLLSLACGLWYAERGGADPGEIWTAGRRKTSELDGYCRKTRDLDDYLS